MGALGWSRSGGRRAARRSRRSGGWATTTMAPPSRAPAPSWAALMTRRSRWRRRHSRSAARRGQ
eukprot:483235-Prymnesium_polylepis.1